MLELKNISYEQEERPLLNEVSFKIEAGQILHLRGSNGSGKTTLLQIIAGLLQPHAGQIYFRNKNIQNDKLLYQANFCYIGHKLGLNALLTVEENCFFNYHQSNKDIAPLLKQFQLEFLKDKPVHQLSEGQRRRVALMRLAFSKPTVWLLDEPWVALDQETIQAFADMMQAHIQNDGMIIITSHQAMPPALKNISEYAL